MIILIDVSSWFYISNKLVIVTTNTGKIIAPYKAQKNIKNQDNCVHTKKSPYPIVVMVIKMYQKTL